MTKTSAEIEATGGCQCGKVRYELLIETAHSHVCHCRMCQRATGGLFAALAGGPKAAFRWTAGTPGEYASSNLARRAFCRDCGTPLGFTYLREDARQYVTIGSLDDPELGRVAKHFGIESKLSFVEFCEDLPREKTGEDPAAATFFADLKSHQYMD